MHISRMVLLVGFLAVVGHDNAFAGLCSNWGGSPYIYDAYTVERCLAEGAWVNARSPSGETPLIGAAMIGDIRAVRMLLAAGARPDILDKAGTSALDRAVAMDHPHVVALLFPLLRKPSRADAQFEKWCTIYDRLSRNCVDTPCADPRTPTQVKQYRSHRELAEVIAWQALHPERRDPATGRFTILPQGMSEQNEWALFAYRLQHCTEPSTSTP